MSKQSNRSTNQTWAHARNAKKAVAAATVYGIDTRTLNQINRAEVKRWTGAIQLFEQTCHYNNCRITISVAGPEPLSSETREKFDELVRTQIFNAQFISYAGEEGLFSPLNAFGRIHPPSSRLPKGERVTLRLPALSSFTLSKDPTMIRLMGELPDDGTEVQRTHTIRFEEGSKTQIPSDGYRYVSAAGAIEIAERKVSLDNGELIVTEHRPLPKTSSTSSV